MYHHNINICIFGENEKLMQAIQNIDSDGHTEFTLTDSENQDPDSVAQADIIIFNGPHDFKAVREQAKPEAFLLACLDADEEERLTEEEKDLLNDIWITPLSEYAFRMRVLHLFAEIGNRDWAAFLMDCLDTFINSLRDMVWFKDVDGIHRKVNDYFCEFVGRPREELEGSTHGEIWGVPESEDLSCYRTDHEAMETGETVSAEEVVETDTGKRLFKTIKTPIRGPEGEILGTVGIAHDLTNMFNLNMELDLFLEMMPLPLMICDVDDRIAKANARFLEFFATDMASILEVDWRDWYEENILHEISPTGEDIYRRFLHGDGNISFLKMISHEMNDMFGNYMGVIHVFEDVTADKELEYNIWKLANTDALTGLANRQAFYEYAKRINRNDKVHIFYIDLDNFKKVNDVYGHKAGDEALKLTASILREVFGRDFPARLGGDEFIVCVRRDAELGDIDEMARNLIELMKERFSTSESLNIISCSVGICYNGSLSEGIEPLIKKADAAMYDAKKQGKACYRIRMGSEEGAAAS